MNIWQAARIIAAGMLLLALFDWPYAYYQALRVVVTVCAILEIVQVHRAAISQNSKTVWTLLFAAVAVIFNPVAPLYLSRDIWRGIDLGAAVVFATQCIRK